MTEQSKNQRNVTQLQRAAIKVHGLVQGVNFRYTFKRFAYRSHLTGRIWNDQSDDHLVHIIVEGRRSDIDRFVGVIEEYQNIQMKEGDEMAPVNSLIEVDSFKIKREYIDSPTFSKFEIYRPELEGADINHVLIAILDKLSMGGALYQRFHHDHNVNFQTLEARYGNINEGMKQANNSLGKVVNCLEERSVNDP